MVKPRRLPKSSLLKFRRAKVHFDALKREVEDFFKPNPHDPVIDFEVNPDDGVVRVRLKKPLPIEWSLSVGDTLYNLRSGLDHIVWATIVRYGGNPTTSNEFPIFLDSSRYSKVDKTGKPVRGSGLAKVEGLPDGAKTCIENLQPYKRTDGPRELHPLWLLHEISNYDKHRLVNVIHASISSGYASVKGLGHGKVERFSLPVGALEDGAIIHRIRPLLGYSFEHQMEVDMKFTPGITFDKEGPGRGLPVFGAIIDMQKFIEIDLLGCLTPFIR